MRPRICEPVFQCQDIMQEDAVALGLVEENQHLTTKVQSQLQQELFEARCTIKELQAKYDQLSQEHEALLNLNRGILVLNSPSQKDDIQDIVAKAPQVQTSRSKGIVIGRDLLTGQEVEYPSANSAANSCDISPATFKRSILNKPRQLRGRHWRTPNMPYWIPPNGFTFDANHFEVSVRYLHMSSYDDPNKVQIFESITSAARIMEHDRRTLTDNVGTGRPYKGYLWRFLREDENGTWRMESESSTSANSNVYSVSGNGRCYGEVIARDLETGEEKEFDCYTQAAISQDISPHVMRDKVIGKTRHINGKTFRWKTDTRYWKPPPYFKFKRDQGLQRVTATTYFVVGIEDESGDKVMYENAKIAAEMENIGQWIFYQYGNERRSINGKKWRKAKKEEVEIYEPVQSDALIDVK